MLASIKSIRTSIDGGYVLSFDVPESEREEVKKLLDMLNASMKLIVEL
jgi:hypothetical protein